MNSHRGADQSPAGGVCCIEGLVVVGMGRSISSWHIPPKARIGPPSRSWEGPRGVFIPGQEHTDSLVSDSGIQFSKHLARATLTLCHEYVQRNVINENISYHNINILLRNQALVMSQRAPIPLTD